MLNRFWALGGQHRAVVRKKLIEAKRLPDGGLASPWDALQFTPAQIVVGLDDVSAGQVRFKHLMLLCFVQAKCIYLHVLPFAVEFGTQRNRRNHKGDVPN